MSNPADSPGAIGFLLLEEAAELGYCGGYLVLNALGRPLEFHCAAPVRPNRGQRILFGESLRPYLLNEVIGPALWAKSTVKPQLLVVADYCAWQFAARASTPLVWIGATDPAPEATPLLSATSPSQAESPWRAVQVGQQTVWVPCGERAEASVDLFLAPLAARLPLSEPFERIRQALAEAHALAESHTNSGGVAA